MATGLWSSPWQRVTAIVLFALMLHLGGTATLPLVDRDEPRFAEATREMLERHDFVVPYFNNTYRFDKPILIYWFQAASVRVWGEGEFAVRFPSALAAALTAAVIYGFGRRAIGDTVGIWAALIFTTSLQTLVHAKMAVADMLLILFMTLGYWSGWELIQAARRSSDSTVNVSLGPPIDQASFPEVSRPRMAFWWWIFYLSSGFAFLAKGPLGWLPFLTLLWLATRTPALVRSVRPLTGFILMLTVVGAWGIPALQATHGEFLSVGIGRHVVQRSVGTLEGHGASHWLGYVATLPLYFVTVFVSFFPWSWFLPWLVRTRWKAMGKPPLEMYLLTGIFLTFGIFSLIRTKLPHYTLPCFPLLALWLAWAFETASRPWIQFRRAWWVGIATGLVASWALIPAMVGLFPSERLYTQAQPSLRPEMEFASVDYDEPSLVWCFRRQIRGWHHPMPLAEVAAFMAQRGPRFCILPTPLMAQALPEAPAQWKRFRTEGFNFVHFKRVDLTLVIKSEE